MSFVGYSPNDLTIADKLFVIIPTTIVFAWSSALAGWWIADQTLAIEPSLLISPLVGAGLGAAACAFVGGVSFPVLIATGTSERIGVSAGSLAGIGPIPLAIVAGGFLGRFNRYCNRSGDSSHYFTICGLLVYRFRRTVVVYCN